MARFSKALTAEGKVMQVCRISIAPLRVTLVEEEQEIDIEPGLERLSKRGYKSKNQPDTLSADWKI